jgi:LDH2 family malate/lactate/ureidoglycolate dehydrogenase
MHNPLDPARWREWATRVLETTGLPRDPAAGVAAGLVEGDLYGHSTHGLALLPDYVEELETGSMERQGAPEVVADAGAIAVWDGQRLPGIWITQLAVEDAIERADRFGLGGIAIRRSHHIGCLAAFLEEPARRGYLILVISSDPSARHVAPYGGKVPVMTPNPIAAGIPRDPDPILIDVSMSTTAAGVVARHKALGRKLPGNWLLDAEGGSTDDPAALANGGTILPIGGVDNGYKGFGLSLLVEALTQSLAGFGRADGPTDWGAGVCVLAFAPSKLAGDAAFRRQTNWLADACLSQASVDPSNPIRLPGQLALERKRQALRDGLVLPDIVFARLEALAARKSVPLPV